MTIKQLMEKRAEVGHAIQALHLEKFRNADSEPSEDDRKRFDTLSLEFDELDRAVVAARSAEVTGVFAQCPDTPGRRAARIATGEEVPTALLDRYQDSRGNVVPGLAKNDSILETLRRSGMHNPEEDHGFNLGRSFRTMAGTSGGAGAFALPTSLVARILDLARAKARVIQAGAVTIPMLTRETTICKMLTDPTASWVGEGKAIPTSEPALGAIVLRARKCATIVPVANELLEDAPGVDVAIINALAGALANELDRVCLFGDGTDNEPLGIWNMPDVQEVACSATDHVISIEDPSQMVQKIYEANGEPGAWIINPKTHGYLSRMQTGNGEWMVMSPDVAPLQRLVTTQIGVAHGTGGNESPVFAGDFRTLIIGIRSMLTIERFREGTADGESAVEHDKTLFLARWRGDIAAERENWLCKLTGNLTANLA